MPEEFQVHSGGLWQRDGKGYQRGGMGRGAEGGGYGIVLEGNDGRGIFRAGVSLFLSFGPPESEEGCFVSHRGFLHRILFEKIFLLLKVIKTL